MRSGWPNLVALAVLLALCGLLGVSCYEKGRQTERAENAELNERAAIRRAAAKEDSIVALNDSLEAAYAREDSLEALRQRDAAAARASGRDWRALSDRTPKADSLGVPGAFVDSLRAAGDRLELACFAAISSCEERVAQADSIRAIETDRAELYRAQTVDLQAALRAAQERARAQGGGKVTAGLIGYAIGFFSALAIVAGLVLGS